MTPEERREHCRRIASKGGKVTASKPGHMSAIGKKGFEAFADRYCSDRGAAVAWIQSKGGMKHKNGYTPPKRERITYGEPCGRITIAKG